MTGLPGFGRGRYGGAAAGRGRSSARCALPDAKSGPRAIWLGRPARQLLAGLPRCNRYVFGEGDVPLPVTRFDAIWRSLRQGAGLSHVRLHDLHHSFASVAILAGETLYITGKLLGHHSPHSTGRYAHLGNDHLARAADQVAKDVERLMMGGD